MLAFTRRLRDSVGSSLVDTARYYAAGLGKALYVQPAFLWAQAIAFKVLITLLPLILLATGIFGLVLRQDNPFETVAGFLQTFLPSSQSQPLITLVSQIQAASGALTLVGSAAFIVTVVTLFSTLRYVIGTAMGGDRHQARSLAGGYLFDVRMVIQVGVLFLISFALTFGANVVSTWSTELGGAWGLDPDLLARFRQGLLGAVALLIPYVLTLGMLVQLYHFVPRPRAPLRSALWGSVVAAVLLEAAKNGFAIYATTLGQFDRYNNADAPLGGLGGVFGLILAFVIWVYLSGLVLVVGAVVTSLHEKRHRPRLSVFRRMWGSLGTRRRHALAHPGQAEPLVAAPQAFDAETETEPQDSQHAA